MDSLFTNLFKQVPNYEEIKSNLIKKENLLVTGITDSSMALVITSLIESKGQNLIITHNEIEARKVYEDVKFLSNTNIYYLGSKEMLFYDVFANSHEEVSNRLKVLNAIIKKEDCLVITTINNLFISYVDLNRHLDATINIEIGDVVDLTGLIKDLIYQGYERVEIVESKGQFSVRGGILDIYSLLDSNPYRIEFFDDEIDSIRIFDVETQLSMEKCESLIIHPTRENLLTEDELEQGVIRIMNDFERYSKSLEMDAIQLLSDKVTNLISKIDNRAHFDIIDNYLTYFTDDIVTLLDLFHRDSMIFLHEPDRIDIAAKNYTEDTNERFKHLLERGEVLPRQYNIFNSYEDIHKEISKRQLVMMQNIPKEIKGYSYENSVMYTVKPMTSFHSRLDFFIDELKELKEKDYKIIISSGTESKCRNIEKEILSRGVECYFHSDVPVKINGGQSIILNGIVSSGFIFEEMKLAIITEKEIFGKVKKKKSKTSKNGRKIKSFRDLKIGDYVVHENHGIGKYIGVEQLRVDDVRKDYLKISYMGTDCLYVPIDQMDLVQRYIGGDDVKPKLNSLSGSEWKKTKTKIKKAIEDMAKDLLKLYATRKTAKGYSYEKDTEWQKIFEEKFMYEETADQLKCIEEVKVDMEKGTCMDRLLCGDVGFGKTEVAIRAVFKAVMDSKQVALLVPTTILAQQHYSTLKERFEGFPVKIDMLSRFRSPGQQRKIIEKLEIGEVDVVVGTHRLLSKDIVFFDLGLLIIDEEQRFGVKHKEVMKDLKKNIDVLTLTATPIPRTLHMSLIGIRDMSIIEDPPEHRYPVETMVLPYSENVIRDAILKELSRGGQAYFVYNRVKDIEKMSAKISRLVPEARVAYAHGQMSERKLEKIMMAFLDREFDVIVCTTIIETGLDIGNVNTMIIYNADKLGLSQLYQLRGRVGRSNRLAYCLLTYERNKVLTEVAEKRLKAIKDFTELGSGFKIAMKDLEIRGAGNLLGARQHGHMSAIGYDLYCKLLEDTIKTLKGEEVDDNFVTTIELNINAYISNSFIKNEVQKLEMYKKIAAIKDKQDAYNIEEEIEDRFGNIPNSVYNLIYISYLKSIAQRLKISSITESKNSIKFEFSKEHKIDPFIFATLIDKYKNKVNISCTNQPYFTYRHSGEKQQLKRLMEIISVIESIDLKNTKN